MTSRWLLPLILSLVAGCAGTHRPHTVELLQPTEVLRVPTDDGATLALHRYQPDGPAHPVPVLVCHGIASNRHTWSLGEDRDLGRFLADRGFDTYLVDLRGHGASSRADPSTSIDTFALHDVPAAVQAVRSATGARRVAWIGHSMGGLVMVAYLAQTPDPPLAAAVTVGSPVDWRGADEMTGLIRGLLRALTGPVPARAAALFYARWDGQLPLDLDRVVYEPSNMGRAELADMMRIGVSPIQSGVREQFAAAIEAGSFVSADGSTDYMQAAAGIDVPFLVIAGRKDHLSPPERTVTFFDALGSPDKTWRVFGLDQGDAADYGHVDLCNGDHAGEDVYPYLAQWLTERLAAPNGP